jgi:tRNA pseudouridine synthase 10
MFESSSKYEYSTMLVGAMIQPSIIDRDDYIRSKYKLRGIDSIKTDITKELAKQFTRKTKKKVDFLDPDITFTINFKDKLCDIRSKSVIILGRYTKTHRGIPQKQKPCHNCAGKGCRTCNFHGIAEFDSIEGKISKYLFTKFGGTLAKFTWIGGEDKSSLVLGSGRPFFVKIQNPLRRRHIFRKKIKLDSVFIHNCKVVSEYNKKPPEFTSLVKLEIGTEKDVESQKLQKLKKIIKTPIVAYEKSGKHSEKTILDLKYKKISKNHLTLIIKVEGGFPVKKFVHSDDVFPTLNQILGTACSCIQFDFYDVELK